jgi:hypothetical protein
MLRGKTHILLVSESGTKSKSGNWLSSTASKPAIDAIDRRDDLPPALGADRATPVHQIHLLD